MQLTVLPVVLELSLISKKLLGVVVPIPILVFKVWALTPDSVQVLELLSSW